MAAAAASPHMPPAHAVAGTGMKNGFGITALCCGVTGIVLGLIPLVGVFAGIALGACGIVFGSLGLGRAKRGEASNRGMAMTGLITGIVACALSVFIFIVFAAGMAALESDYNSYALTGSPQALHAVMSQENTMAHQAMFIGNL